MFEFEINSIEESVEDIPSEIIASMSPNKNITARSYLAWGEHCTECAMPHCFKTCDLYEKRSDGKCRRFVNGIVKIRFPDSYYGYLFKITFKLWGTLLTPGSALVYPNISSLQKIYQKAAKTARFIPYGIGRARIPRLFSQLNKKAVVLLSKIMPVQEANYFMVALYNPGEPIGLLLKITPKEGSSRITFDRGLEIKPGYNEFLINIEEIKEYVDLAKKFTINLIPDIGKKTATLYFSLIDFVKINSTPKNSPEAEKLAVQEQKIFFDFLRSCQIKLKITTSTIGHVNVLHDLVQRTNELNFSFNRYTREDVDNIVKNEKIDKYILLAKDRFTDYGVIGFVVVDDDQKSTVCITDLFLSCKIRDKMVESTVLKHLLQKYKDLGRKKMLINYSQTRRNKGCEKIIREAGFKDDKTNKNKFIFDLNEKIVKDNVILIEEA